MFLFYGVFCWRVVGECGKVVCQGEMALSKTRSLAQRESVFGERYAGEPSK